MAAPSLQSVGAQPQQYPAPYTKAKVVTPDDNVDLTFQAKALYVGNTGDVTIYIASGDGTTTNATVLFKAVPAGTILPVAAVRVLSTGTTSTSITALWW